MIIYKNQIKTASMTQTLNKDAEKTSIESTNLLIIGCLFKKSVLFSSNELFPQSQYCGLLLNFVLHSVQINATCYSYFLKIKSTA